MEVPPTITIPSDSDSDNNNLLNMPSTSSGHCGYIDTNISLTTRRPIALKLQPLITNENNFYQRNINDLTNETILDINLKTNTTAIITSRKADDDDCLITKSSKKLNIGFSDLTYSVKTGILRRENRTILNGLNGNFLAGDLTAVMGPSGAGKSTLLDILAGYTRKNVGGTIRVNGRTRDIKKFRRQAAYIMQDHQLQPLLTVTEAMHFSANLKIGDEMTQDEKQKRITQILRAIGLYDSRKCRTGVLSGGQRKRLAIALELVNNPPVMFFDEPTSGLDSSTSTNCIQLLKQLALEGRTIICTIHQPSAKLFGLFDHLFAIADGQCIYTGATCSVVPYLAELGLKCPEFYNPSDYLLEISTSDYGYHNDKLVRKTYNGSCEEYRKRKSLIINQNGNLHRDDIMIGNGLMTPVRAPQLSPPINTPLTPVIETPTIENLQNKPKKPGLNIDPRKCCKRDERYATSFHRQFCLLLMRTFLILWRDKSLTTMRLIIHLTVAPLIGFLYIGIGNDASNIFNNFSYVFFSIMFLMFTAFSSMMMAFPLELPIITREHFNRWYSLRAYYIAMTLADIPIQVCCTLLYTLITYYMTSQPMEIQRLVLFVGICLMVTFVAQSLGLVIGSLFSVKNGAIFGPFFICPFLIFSGFFIHMTDANPIMHWLFHISFLKYALEGASLAIFGFDRAKLECSEYFCQYVLPKKFMKAIDMHNGDYPTAMLALIIIFLIFRFTAFYVMLYRLRHRR